MEPARAPGPDAVPADGAPAAGRLVVAPGVVAPDAAVPGSGVVAVFAALSPAWPEPLRWGVDGEVLRRDGPAWGTAGRFAVALDDWASVGRLGSRRRPLVVPRVGLGGLPGGFGPLGWVDLTGLAPGEYLLVQQARAHDSSADGPVVLLAGEVRVLPPGAPAPAANGPPPRRAALTTSAAVRPGAAQRLVLRVRLDPSTGGTAADERRRRAALVGDLAATARVEAGPADAAPLGSAPAAAGRRAVDGAADLPVTSAGEDGTFAVDVPPLPPGGYRLVVGSSEGGDLWAPFWAADPG